MYIPEHTRGGVRSMSCKGGVPGEYGGKIAVCVGKGREQEIEDH